MKMNNNKKNYLAGIKDGIPIALGYFAVGFTLGIAAKSAGLSVFLVGFMSFLMHASAGQFAVLTVITAGSGYLAMILTQLVINIRYLLMSCSLSQKISPSTSLPKRMLMSYFVTDEIFGICASVKGELNPNYPLGAATVASPGWILGTALGALVGNILPATLSSALSVALFAMFLAVVIPASKTDKTIAIVVLVSMIGSCAFDFLPVLSNIDSGTKIIILTLMIASGAAILKPVKDTDADTQNTKSDEKNTEEVQQ